MTAEAGGGRAAWWKRELQRGLVLFFYLWILLALFVLNEDLASRKLGDHVVFHGFALINALILTKVMMLSEHIDLARRLDRWRRIWVILAEAIFCTVIFLIVHVLERVVIGLFHGQAPGASMPSFGGGGLTGLLIVSLILFVSLLPFFTFKIVARAIGADRIQAILFGRADAATPARE